MSVEVEEKEGRRGLTEAMGEDLDGIGGTGRGVEDETGQTAAGREPARDVAGDFELLFCPGDIGRDDGAAINRIEKCRGRRNKIC